MRTATIKLDYDDRRKRPDEQRITQILLDHGMQVVEYQSRKSRSGTGWHVIAKVTAVRCFGKITPVRIVAAQLALGSDPARELYNLYRVIQMTGAPLWWRRRWNVLFRALPKQPKGEKYLGRNRNHQTA